MIWEDLKRLIRNVVNHAAELIVLNHANPLIL